MLDYLMWARGDARIGDTFTGYCRRMDNQESRLVRGDGWQKATESVLFQLNTGHGEKYEYLYE